MSRGRLFGTLCTLVFLVNLARVMFAPLVSEFIEVFSVTAGTAGLIVTLVWLGSALPRIPTGWLLTRVSRHAVVLATGLVLTAAAVFTASANSVVALAAGAMTMGLASGVYFVAANPLVSELYPGRVGRAMGIHGTASQLAAVGAAPIVTVALFWNWRVAFVGVGVAAALATVAFFRTARRTTLPRAGREDRNLLRSARREWRLILVGVTILGATGFVWQGLFNFFELYMRTKGLAPATAKNMLTVVFAAGVPAFFVSGRLADRLPQVTYLLGILVAFVACVFALTAAEGLIAVAAMSAVLGYVVHSLFPALDTYLLDSLPDESRGSAYAVYSGGMMITQAGGSVAVGALRDAGFAFDAIFAALTGALGAIVAALVAFHRAGRFPS